MAGELKQLAQFVCDFRLEALSPETVTSAKYCVLDNMGAALGAARSEELASIGKRYCEWSGVGSSKQDAAAWCSGYRTNLFTALLVNGMMSHELEMDDVHTASKSHVGAVVVPVAWSLADAIGASGKQFLESVVVGYEVMGRVGRGMDVASNRKRGWHTTGITGTFGAAAAAAKLLKLSPMETINAFGMAGTQSSGLWAFLAEGATCKKLHTARAALNGLSSCLLAQSGMTGAEQILDAQDGGLYAAVSDSFDISRLCAEIGEKFEICNVDKKPYPCCRTTNHAIDAALSLTENESVKPKDIVSVLVETYDVGVLQCGFKKYPETPVEAKFSIPFTCAVAFTYGRVTQGEFCAEVIEDPEVRRIAKATNVVADELFTARYPTRWGCRLTVTMKNGSKKVCQIDDMSGSVMMPLSSKQEENKFLGLVGESMGAEKAMKLMEAILGAEYLERLPDLA